MRPDGSPEAEGRSLHSRPPDSLAAPLHLTDNEYDGCFPDRDVACDVCSAEIAWWRRSHFPRGEMRNSFQPLLAE
jgi:hypothetical protein